MIKVKLRKEGARMMDEKLVNGEVEGGRIYPTDTEIDEARAEADAEGENYFVAEVEDDDEDIEEFHKKERAIDLHKDLLIMHYILDNCSEAYYEYEGKLRKVFDILGEVMKDMRNTYNIEGTGVWVSMDKTYFKYKEGVKVQ